MNSKRSSKNNRSAIKENASPFLITGLIAAAPYFIFILISYTNLSGLRWNGDEWFRRIMVLIQYVWLITPHLFITSIVCTVLGFRRTYVNPKNEFRFYLLIGMILASLLTILLVTTYLDDMPYLSFIITPIALALLWSIKARVKPKNDIKLYLLIAVFALALITIGQLLRLSHWP